MEDKVYARVATEMTEIFKYLDIGLLYRIPKVLRDKLVETRDRDYVFQYDTGKSLNEQNVLPETKDFFASLYLEFCCSDEEKLELIKTCKANDLK
ncbi:MAG: hypothetical protein IJ867_06820 [Clostridia bacterium]|nr:hypothetical protein [Clostridia bacterium]